MVAARVFEHVVLPLLSAITPADIAPAGIAAADGRDGLWSEPHRAISGLDPTPPTKIAALTPKAEGDRVVIQGKVVAIAPLVRQSVYEVQDESGVIWVLTHRRPPQRHAQVKIHGVMRSSNGERYIDQK
jgi:hypothetical protein